MADPCPSCGKPILFAVVANNAGRKPKLMPLDADPDDGGNVAAWRDDTGTLRGRVLGKGQKPVPPERLMMPHFATCADPAAHRRRQRGNLKSVQSEHAAAKRRKRAAPNPAPQLPYLGYRKTP